MDHDLISPWSESESLETALMDNLTVSCLCSSEKDFISRLYMAVRKGGSPQVRLIRIRHSGTLCSALNASACSKLL